MKKITLLLAVIAISSAAFSQNVISLRGGVTKNFSTGAPTFFGPGASFQRGINENIALGLNFDYHVAENSQSWMNIEPRVDYYFDKVFQGFHAGSNIGYTTYSISSIGVSQLHIGASLGYTHPLSENLQIDIASGLGYTLFSGEGSLGIRPALSIGYKF